MAKALQRRRGTTAEHANFTGLEGEFTYDTTEKRIVAHDGVTKGGIPMAKVSEVSSAKTELEGKINAIDVGVTSFNGSKGDVTYSAPVSSVNGKTGAVTVDVGVTSVNGKTGAVTGIVTSVNGASADASGNVTLSISAPVTSVMGKTGAVTGLLTTATKLSQKKGTPAGAPREQIYYQIPSGGTWLLFGDWTCKSNSDTKEGTFAAEMYSGGSTVVIATKGLSGSVATGTSNVYALKIV